MTEDIQQLACDINNAARKHTYQVSQDNNKDRDDVIATIRKNLAELHKKGSVVLDFSRYLNGYYKDECPDWLATIATQLKNSLIDCEISINHRKWTRKLCHRVYTGSRYNDPTETCEYDESIEVPGKLLWTFVVRKYFFLDIG